MSDHSTRIAELYRAGHRPGQIAKELGVSPNTVTATLRRDGLAPKIGRPAKVDRERALTLWNHGLSTAAIAERLGVTQASVIKRLRSMGVKFSLTGKRTRYDGEGGCVGIKGGAHARIARRA